jgi:hypothetical protein
MIPLELADIARAITDETVKKLVEARRTPIPERDGKGNLVWLRADGDRK